MKMPRLSITKIKYLIISLSAAAILSFAIAMLLFAKAKVVPGIAKKLSFNSSGNIAYEVEYVANSVFDDTMVSSGLGYVEKFVKSIHPTINYSFELSDEAMMHYNYIVTEEFFVMGNVKSGETRTIYSEINEIERVDNAAIENSSLSINNNTLSIDYNAYNQKCKEIIKQTGVSLACELRFKVNVYESGIYNDSALSNNDTMELDISLNNSLVSISNSGANINKNENMVEELEKAFSKLPGWLFIGITFVLVIIIFILCELLAANGDVERYYKTQSFIKKYGSLIVKCQGEFDPGDKMIVDSKSIDDIVTVAEIHHVPIQLYSNFENHVFTFVVATTETYYKLVVKI